MTTMARFLTRPDLIRNPSGFRLAKFSCRADAVSFAVLFTTVPPTISMDSCVVATSPSETIFRSEEHTSELQSQSNLVCRLLLEKKKNVEDFGRCRLRIKYVSTSLR